jgi:hypothetical protein
VCSTFVLACIAQVWREVRGVSLIHNERTKLLALAFNTAATSAFTVGVLAPVAAAFYDLGTPPQRNRGRSCGGGADFASPARLALMRCGDGAAR